MPEVDTVIRLLQQTLHLDPAAPPLAAASPLLGHVPELDSLAVVELLGAVEAHYGIVIEDHEISAEVFATVGSLARFIAQRTAA
jgi:acyl carrier protein